MKVAGSFQFPLRAGAAAAWAAGLPLLLLFPVTFLLVFGYFVRLVRRAADDFEAPPARLAIDARLLADGLLMTLAAVLALLPYGVATALLGGWLRSQPPFTLDPVLGSAEAVLAAGLAVLLPWGLLVIVLAPPAIAAYAGSGRPRDLFDPVAAVRLVVARFAEWNLAGVAIVTAWTLALASAGLCGIGFLAGAWYAILVSAHAIATLTQAADAPPGPAPAPAR